MQPEVHNASGADGPNLPGKITRGRVQQIIADALMIQTDRGIHNLTDIEIGGIRQWISVRGRDRANPVLLFIHGGPGTTEMPVSWFYQSPLEDYFTVVHWDQRGSGKTAASNDPVAVIPTITIEQMVNDAEEVISHLLEEHDKDKLIVIGHSWGTLIGLELANRHPQWLHAYVGMGQLINTRENEEVGYRFALDEAHRRNDDTAIEELEAIAPYPPEEGTASIPATVTQRKWVSAYGGMTWGRPNLEYETNLRLLSPDYSDDDLESDEGIMSVVEQLLPQLGDVDYRDITRLEVPVFLFSGRHDYAVPSEISLRWLQSLEAPDKKVIWFENSAHMMHLEEPGRFFYHLIQDVRPMAVATR